MTTPASSIIVALDVGEQRIGIATASTVARLPGPHGIIKQSPGVYRDITALLKGLAAKVVVIGLPRGLEGQETAQTAFVRSFATKLRERVSMPIYFQDEAMTSKKAEEELRTRGTRYNRGDVDALAAVYILADFLNEHPRQDV